MSATPVKNDLSEIDYMPRLSGDRYQSVLANLHALLMPRTYLEVGTDKGGSLHLARCKSIAVDAQFRLNANVIASKPSCHFFQMKSDEFFNSVDPTAILGAKVDLAFLDGMHLFEYLLRDFIGTERACKRNSVICLHDCLPPSIYTTVRDASSPLRQIGKYPDFWAGDVWKCVKILRDHRPDLAIYAVNAPPTGLVIVTNLNPEERTLEKNYHSLVSEYSLIEPSDRQFDEYWRSVSLVDTNEFASIDRIARYCWL